MLNTLLQILERAPAAPSGSGHVLFEQFWLERGPAAPPEAPTADGNTPLPPAQSLHAHGVLAGITLGMPARLCEPHHSSVYVSGQP